jgi:hypothetical protein
MTPLVKKLLIVILLLGVMTVEAKPKYRIQTWLYSGTRYYLPERKVWYTTNYFPLPFKVWKAGSYPFQHKSQAEEIIENWKSDLQSKMEYKRSEYIIVE